MWLNSAKFIIKNRFFILCFLALECFLFAFLIQPKFPTSETSILPNTDETFIQFKEFRNTFGQEDNLITIGVKDTKLFTAKNWNLWQNFAKKIESDYGISLVLSIADLKILEKNDLQQKFNLKPAPKSIIKSDKEALFVKDSIFKTYPFYEQLIFNSETNAIRTAIYLKPEYVDTKDRGDYVLELINRVKQLEKELGFDVKVSGLPITRTLNAVTIKSELLLSIGGTLLVTSCIFFAFFRSFRLTFTSLLVVIMSVVTTFASMYLLQYDISILTALIPPLLIVISIPNCIFLINKYLQEYTIHQNKIKALVRMIMKVGNATLLTNLTTAFGFLTFIFTSSDSLVEFGIIAGINIFGIFLYSILLVPTVLSYMPSPKPKYLNHLSNKNISSLINWMANLVLHKRKAVFITTAIVLVLSAIGASLLKKSGNMLDDLPKNTTFYKDIAFFDKEFRGILPIEIMIDTKREKGVHKASTYKRINQMTEFIDKDTITSKGVSISNLIKFTKQAYFGNNPDFYEMPSRQERSFIMSYLKNTGGDANLLNNYIDSTAQRTRITTLLRNIPTEEMQLAFGRLQVKIKEIFPEEKYNTYLTGGAYVFLQSTHYLTLNLLQSIGLAFLMIALFMAVMFRTPKMILISLFPNMLPLIVTAGLMGYLDIPIKPSTILVFSIAFGIAVDDTIHFLAKYRQELKVNKGDIKTSVINALKETGLSMFYTSIVLFFGFSVFLLSSFGGTKALGGLISLTLFVAMLSDLVLLPALLLAFEKQLTPENFKESIDLFEIEEDDLNVNELTLPNNKKRNDI